MKRLIAAFFFLFFLAACQKGEKIDQSQVPDPVVNSFYERYPVATEMEWRKDGNIYVVNFDYDGEPKKVRFKEDGTFLEAVR